MRPDPKTSELARSVRVDWTATDLERRLGALVAARRGRERARAARRGVATLGLGGLVVYAVLTGGDRAPAPPEAALPTRQVAPLILPDGTSVEAASTGAIVIERHDGTELRVALTHGAATFDVRPSATRVFRVRAGQARVSVLGTRFTVTRAERHLDVRVARGRVEVEVSGELSRVLTDGEEGRFSTESSPWPTLAQAGRYQEALAALHAMGEGLSPKTPAMALLAADAARGIARYADARAALEGALARGHGGSGGALVAFALGKLLMQNLSLPGEAAAAFARARALDPKGPLAEDALAREVEAWARTGGAGGAALARARAQLYRELYPRGLRSQEVSRWGRAP